VSKDTTVSSFEVTFYCENVLVPAGKGPNNDPEDRTCHTQLVLRGEGESVTCEKCGTSYTVDVKPKAKGAKAEEKAEEPEKEPASFGAKK
jgi:hypothetical protein